MVAGRHQGNNLTAAMRVFILAYYRAAATEQGHSSAGHGKQRRKPTISLAAAD